MSLFSKLSYISRVQKLELFKKIIRPTEQWRVLDVGTEINPDGDRGLQLIDSYPWKSKVFAIKTSAEHIKLIKKHYPEIEAVVGDARDLPWPDKYFDAVYCNAVIEHLGDFENQKKNGYGGYASRKKMVCNYPEPLVSIRVSPTITIRHLASWA